MIETQIQTKQIFFNEKRNIESNWYVLYTYPRAEKVVFKELLYRGYDAFLPMNKVLKVYKCRNKKYIEEVLFPGYIFVNTWEPELYNIRRVTKVVNYIHCGGKPAIVPFKDIECIKKMLRLNQDITIENTFCQGQLVRVIQGPLAGHEGILINQTKKARFGIQLKEINQTAFIEVCTDVLEKIQEVFEPELCVY